jgi:type IV secretion system protein VirB4
MALQFLRYRDAQVFIFDKGASCRASVLAVGGDFFDLGDADGEIAFQPLRHLDDADQIAWAVNWLSSLLRLRGLEVSQERDQHLHRQLQLLAQNPPEDRTLSVFSGLIQDLDARRALTSFTLDGPYGHLLDAEERGFGYARVQAFEMERFMRDVSARDVLVPVLTYLFHRLEDRFDGRPTLLIVDEAWSFLLDDDFAPQIVKWLTRLRKKNVSVILATQNLADIIQCPVAQTLIQQTMSRIFLPNFRALDPIVQPLYEAFGLNDRQIEIIAHATPKRDYYYESSVGNRLFELALGQTALAFAGASTPADQALIDEILQKGRRSVFAETFLERKGLADAAATLAAYRRDMAAFEGEAA